MIVTFYHFLYRLWKEFVLELLKRPLVIILGLYILAVVILDIFFPSLLFQDGESEALRESLEQGTFGEICGRVADLTEKGDKYLVFLEEVKWLGKASCGSSGEMGISRIEGENTGERILGVRCWFSKKPSFDREDQVILRGKMTRFASATVPGQFDAAFYYKLRGYGYEMSNPGICQVKYENTLRTFLKRGIQGMREKLEARLTWAFQGKDQGVFSAILIGNKTALDEELKELWQTGGIVHMLVISGLHLTLAAAFVKWLLKCLGLSLTVSFPLSFFLLLFYAALTGFAVSTLRALLMYGYVGGAEVLGRKGDRWQALSLAALLILSGNPTLLFDAGFQLSFGAVFFLTAFGGGGGLRTALILQLGLLPLILYYYGELPLFSLFLNLLLVPLLPVLLISGLMGLMGGGIWTLPGEWLVGLVEGLLKLMRQGTSLTLITGKPQGVMILIYWFFLISGILIFDALRAEKGDSEMDRGAEVAAELGSFRRKIYLRLVLTAFIPALIFLLTPTFWPRRCLEISFLDVGQGDAILMQTPSGESCLMDGGSSSVSSVGVNRLIPCLKVKGIRCLDHLVVTHLDSDHISGIYEILERAGEKRLAVNIKNLILPLTADGSEAGELCKLALSAGTTVHYAGEGDKIIFHRKGGEETVLSFLSPLPGKAYESSNAGCLTAELSFGDFDCLLTGDLEGEGEETLTAKLLERKAEGSLPSYEVLKVAHHGSRYSSSEAFLETVSADAYVISCSLNNLYHHPHPELLSRLEETGGLILKTMEMGTITIKSNGKVWSLTTWNAT